MNVKMLTGLCLRVRVIRRLKDMGHDETEIAGLFQTTPRSVYRWQNEWEMWQGHELGIRAYLDVDLKLDLPRTPATLSGHHINAALDAVNPESPRYWPLQSKLWQALNKEI